METAAQSSHAGLELGWRDAGCRDAPPPAGDPPHVCTHMTANECDYCAVLYRQMVLDFCVLILLS